LSVTRSRDVGPAFQPASSELSGSKGGPTAAVSKEELRDRLIARLRAEQQEAQARVASGKQQGTSPAPVDRDVAGWLAAGLADLFSDPITAKQFLNDSKGIIARLAGQLSDGSPLSRFAESDFLRPADIRFMEATRPAQTMLTKLNLASTNQFRVAAAELMNRIVDTLAPTPQPAIESVAPIWLIDDAEAGIFEKLGSGCRAVIIDRQEHFLDRPGVHIWRIAEILTKDQERILRFAAAYLDVVRTSVFETDISASEELLRLLVKEVEASITPRLLLERLSEAAEAGAAGRAVAEPEAVAGTPEVAETSEVGAASRATPEPEAVPGAPERPEAAETPIAPEQSEAAAALVEADAELKRAWSGVAAFLRQAEFLKSQGILKQRDIPKSTAVSKGIAEVRELMADPSVDLRQNKKFSGLLKQIDKFGIALRDKLSACWRAWLDSWTPVIDAEQMARLEVLPNQQEFVGMLRALREKATSLNERVPGSLEEVAESARILDELRVAIEHMPSLLYEAEVRAFLAAVEGGGAPLSMLSDVVLGWLRSSGRVDGLRVVPK